MTYRDLGERRDLLGEVAEVGEAQVVPCVELQPEGEGSGGRLTEGGDRLLWATREVLGSVGLGVELDASCTYLGGSLYLPEVGGDEDRGTDTPLSQLGDDVPEEGSVGDDVPARIARQCIGSIGDEGDLCRTYLADEVHELRGGVALDVELRGEHFPQLVDVPIADVPLVGARMDGNPLGSEGFAV